MESTRVRLRVSPGAGRAGVVDRLRIEKCLSAAAGKEQT
jgi:hypothetical protein